MKSISLIIATAAIVLISGISTAQAGPRVSTSVQLHFPHLSIGLHSGGYTHIRGHGHYYGHHHRRHHHRGYARWHYRLRHQYHYGNDYGYGDSYAPQHYNYRDQQTRAPAKPIASQTVANSTTNSKLSHKHPHHKNRRHHRHGPHDAHGKIHLRQHQFCAQESQRPQACLARIHHQH